MSNSISIAKTTISNAQDRVLSIAEFLGDAQVAEEYYSSAEAAEEVAEEVAAKAAEDHIHPVRVNVVRKMVEAGFTPASARRLALSEGVGVASPVTTGEGCTKVAVLKEDGDLMKVDLKDLTDEEVKEVRTTMYADGTARLVLVRKDQFKHGVVVVGATRSVAYKMGVTLRFEGMTDALAGYLTTLGLVAREAELSWTYTCRNSKAYRCMVESIIMHFGVVPTITRFYMEGETFGDTDYRFDRALRRLNGESPISGKKRTSRANNQVHFFVEPGTMLHEYVVAFANYWSGEKYLRKVKRLSAKAKTYGRGRC